MKFNPKGLETMIAARLQFLSKAPRRINFYPKDDHYCLRYEERIAIEQRNLRDRALLEAFHAQTEDQLKGYITTEPVDAASATQLIQVILHKLFADQGLEFARFVSAQHAGEFEKNLPAIIDGIAEAHFTKKEDRAQVRHLLLKTFRNIVYNGTVEQKQFLTKLSQTYMLMFLLQCEPQVSTYFQALAGKLVVYVDTSILIPALSEHFLEPQNKRYYSLLQGAAAAGTRLVINRTIAQELADHFSVINSVYENEYIGHEDVYETEEAIAYVQRLMIRSYLYARMRGRVDNWRSFLNAFVNPRNIENSIEDVIEFLKGEFQIEFVDDRAEGIQLDTEVLHAVQEALEGRLQHVPESVRRHKAKNDATVILTVYGLRDKNNEQGKTGIFGYSSWWLSSDQKSYRAVRTVLGERYPVSCYMRPDFLYNYVALAPKASDVKANFEQLFPTLLGVNISYRVPREVSDTIDAYLKEHASLTPGRKRAILRDLANRLKSDYQLENRETLRTYLDELTKQHS